MATHLLNRPGPRESHRRSGYLEHSDDALHRLHELSDTFMKSSYGTKEMLERLTLPEGKLTLP